MNQKKFLEQYTYTLESDFTSATGETARWAPDHPKYWGQERATIQLEGKASSTPALSRGDAFVAVGVDEEIVVFYVSTLERREVLKGHTGTVGTVWFGGEVEHGYLLVSEGDDGVVILWELDTHGRLASRGEDKTIDADGLADKAMQPLVSELTTGYGWEATEKAVDTIDKAVRDTVLVAIRIHEQEQRLCFQGKLASFGSPAFSPDGRILIYLSHNKTTQNGLRDAASMPCVNLWDVRTRSLRHELRGHQDSIMWACMSPDNTLLASIAWDGTARIWDVSSGSCLQVFGPFGGQLWCGAFSPDGKHLAISQGSPKTHVHVYDLSSGQSVSRFDGFNHWGRSLAWSPDGTVLACGGGTGELRIWDPYTGEERMRWSLGFEDRKMRLFATVRGVQFVDGGRRLVFRVNEGTTEVYDFETNLKLQFTRRPGDRIERCSISGLTCSSDSRFLVVPDDGVLRLWDL